MSTAATGDVDNFRYSLVSLCEMMSKDLWVVAQPLGGGYRKRR